MQSNECTLVADMLLTRTVEDLPEWMEKLFRRQTGKNRESKQYPKEEAVASCWMKPEEESDTTWKAERKTGTVVK